jgi:hypothetical protein
LVEKKVHFGAFLDQGSSKTPWAYFCKKSLSKTFYKKPTKNPRCIFPSFFGFYGRFLVREVKNTIQNFVKKIHVEFVLQKKSTKIQCRFFLDFLVFLGVSRQGESENTIKVLRIKTFDPVTFLASDPPTTGVSDFFFGRPLAGQPFNHESLPFPFRRRGYM